MEEFTKEPFACRINLVECNENTSSVVYLLQKQLLLRSTEMLVTNAVKIGIHIVVTIVGIRLSQYPTKTVNLRLRRYSLYVILSFLTGMFRGALRSHT